MLRPLFCGGTTWSRQKGYTAPNESASSALVTALAPRAFSCFCSGGHGPGGLDGTGPFACPVNPLLAAAIGDIERASGNDEGYSHLQKTTPPDRVLLFSHFGPEGVDKHIPCNREKYDASSASTADKTFAWRAITEPILNI